MKRWIGLLVLGTSLTCGSIALAYHPLHPYHAMHHAAMMHQAALQHHLMQMQQAALQHQWATAAKMQQLALHRSPTGQKFQLPSLTPPPFTYPKAAKLPSLTLPAFTYPKAPQLPSLTPPPFITVKAPGLPSLTPPHFLPGAPGLPSLTPPPLAQVNLPQGLQFHMPPPPPMPGWLGPTPQQIKSAFDQERRRLLQLAQTDPVKAWSEYQANIAKTMGAIGYAQGMAGMGSAFLGIGNTYSNAINSAGGRMHQVAEAYNNVLGGGTPLPMGQMPGSTLIPQWRDSEGRWWILLP